MTKAGTLLQAALAGAADLEVAPTELRVTLAAQSSPHRTRAIAALCEELSQKETFFPESARACATPFGKAS